MWRGLSVPPNSSGSTLFHSRQCRTFTNADSLAFPLPLPFAFSSIRAVSAGFGGLWAGNAMYHLCVWASVCDSARPVLWIRGVWWRHGVCKLCQRTNLCRTTSRMLRQRRVWSGTPLFELSGDWPNLRFSSS